MGADKNIAAPAASAPAASATQVACQHAASIATCQPRLRKHCIAKANQLPAAPEQPVTIPSSKCVSLSKHPSSDLSDIAQSCWCIVCQIATWQLYTHLSCTVVATGQLQTRTHISRF